MSKDGQVDSSSSERPGHDRPRRLADWLNPTGARKVHSLIDKVYKRKNLEIAWERVRANQGAGGIDGESIAAFGERCEERLAQLHEELRTGSYRPSPVRQQRIPKAGKPGEWRMLGIPTVYDRVCQQALLNRLEPIFEPVFDDASFGYRKGRSTKDAMRKICGASAKSRDARHAGDPRPSLRPVATSLPPDERVAVTVPVPRRRRDRLPDLLPRPEPPPLQSQRL